ncbi:hypothetical protein PPERSA_03585 [Pseudocohnilembus persalinus]|uniref:Tubulin-tyrosine ligase/Tubulin polyglutamylase n=1 Tax=Pseudocohnilembus persalinus TaxID=266149 RepID=A0A0V0QQ22_PSEPJ|nr:hypothetical protein PPERSA_03585 [Pseudocohnilembus persalinus]|eukprot:KRX04345.1 hypothetical protein PPERSA_03585 [Pseudocohnilembus persalinus]
MLVYTFFIKRNFHNQIKSPIFYRYFTKDLNISYIKNPYKADIVMDKYKNRENLNSSQMLIKIEGTQYLANKILYTKVLNNLDQNGGYNGFNSTLFNPPSYSMNFQKIGILTKDEKLFLSRNETGIWIMKPAATYGGTGIQLIRNIESVKQALYQKLNNQTIDAIQDINLKYSSFTLQKYIDKPLLLKGEKKFDYRCYVFYVSSDPLIAVYVPGFIRETMVKYKQDSENLMTHIGNGQFQRAYPNYWKKLRKSSYDMRLFKEKLLDKFPNLKEKDYYNLIDKIKASLAYSIQSAKDKFKQNKGDFQIQGIDIIGWKFL